MTCHPEEALGRWSLRTGRSGRVVAIVDDPGWSLADAAAAWDAEYAAGRYVEEAPVGFVDDILTAAVPRHLRHGVYISCGNGRNLAPMLDAGLDLTALDISTEAITQLRRCRPDRIDKLIVGDVTMLPAAVRYGWSSEYKCSSTAPAPRPISTSPKPPDESRPAGCPAFGSTPPTPTSSTRTSTVGSDLATDESAV